jgi:hypothetical protein
MGVSRKTLPQTEQGLELHSGPKGEMEPFLQDLKPASYQATHQGNVEHENLERDNKARNSLMVCSRK